GGSLSCQRDHERRGTDSEEHEEERPRDPGPRAERDDEEQRKEHIELLLNGERPSIPVDLRVIASEVVAANRDEDPVAHERDRAEDLRLDVDEEIPVSTRECEARADEERDPEGGKEAARTPAPERCEVDAAGTVPLPQK